MPVRDTAVEVVDCSLKAVLKEPVEASLLVRETLPTPCTAGVPKCSAMNLGLLTMGRLMISRTGPVLGEIDLDRAVEKLARE